MYDKDVYIIAQQFIILYIQIQINHLINTSNKKNYKN